MSNANRTPEENNQAVDEAVGDVELTDAEIDEAAGGVRRAAVSKSNTKSSHTFLCHGPACCAAGGYTSA